MKTKHIVIECPVHLQNKSASEIFGKLAHLEWATLLDTCNNQLSDGRFDIICADPIAFVQAKNGKINGYRTQLTNTNNCPFECLDDALAKFKKNIAKHYTLDTSVSLEDAGQLPFVVGAMGQFGYDLNTQLDAITDTDRSRPEPEYSADDFAVGIYDESLIFDNRSGKVFYCHMGRQKLLNLIEDTETAKRPSFELTQAWKSSVEQNEYVDHIKQIDDYLRAGDCYQINYAQRFEAAYSGDEWDAYLRLRKVNKAPFSSFIRHKDYAILSLSPERFIQIKDGLVETKPIKGTRPRFSNPLEDKASSDALLASEKDKAENLMIVDLLRNDLSKHCQAHSVKVPALFKLESYPAVHHMVSTVVGKLKSESSPISLLKGAFPGGSITGAPKVRAMQIIRELEKHKRSIYCGSIAYIGYKGDMDSNICIRTILAENSKLYCWAGGGIVLDSEALSEYQESYDKVAKILPVLSQDSVDIKTDVTNSSAKLKSKTTQA